MQNIIYRCAIPGPTPATILLTRENNGFGVFHRTSNGIKILAWYTDRTKAVDSAVEFANIERRRAAAKYAEIRQ